MSRSHAHQLGLTQGFTLSPINITEMHVAVGLLSASGLTYNSCVFQRPAKSKALHYWMQTPSNAGARGLHNLDLSKQNLSRLSRLLGTISTRYDIPSYSICQSSGYCKSGRP